MSYILTDPAVIRALCSEFGFSFTKSLGQNFIVSQSVVDRMAEAARLDRDTGVLEIGPGAGTLTQELARRAGRVVAVELDSTLLPLLTKTLAGYDNVEIINADALKIDLKTLCREQFMQKRLVVVANLPYYITTQLVLKLLETGIFESLTLMLQKEAADRLCSAAGSAAYCAAAAELGYYAESHTLFRVPAECYIPRPTVGSVVIRLKTRPARLDGAGEALLLRLINAAFAQRRKTLANALTNSGLCDRVTAARLISNGGFSPAIRGEALTPEDFIGLARGLKEQME